MTDFAFESDLLVLTADKNMQFAVKGLLDRPKDMGIRPIRAVYYTHPERDPGCLLRSDNFLRPFIKHAAFAIVIFDREGCGKHNKARIELESEVSSRLAISGWKNRSACITIDPELENWVFSDSPEVGAALGWSGSKPPLRVWLENQGFLMPNQVKPHRPKDAMEAALRQARLPRSSSIYAGLAERVGLGRCTDEAFLKLKNTLQSWFPVPDGKQR